MIRNAADWDNPPISVEIGGCFPNTTKDLRFSESPLLFFIIWIINCNSFLPLKSITYLKVIFLASTT